MDEKNEYGFNFNFDESKFDGEKDDTPAYEDISSTSSHGAPYEDISSSSASFVPMSGYSSAGKHSAEPEKSVYKVINSINNAWHKKSAGVRALFTVLIILAVLGVNFLIWRFPPFHVGYRGRTFLSAWTLLVTDLAVFFSIAWKKRSLQNALATFTAVLMSAVIIATSVLWNQTNKLFFNYNPSINIKTEQIDKRIINIALFGIDTRSPDVFEGLSDSIMILSLNTETKTVKVISVMRDSFVPIIANGKTTYGKINTAYSKGGPEAAIKTLNNAFGLDISEYATVNFFGMVDIIDAVGGIDATITDDELAWKGSGHPNLNNAMDEICAAKKLSAAKYHIKKSGPQHLNGVQAVAYARVRNCTSIWGTTNDYGRTDRQRYVMEQLFNKATKMSKSDYTRLATSLIPCTETSLDIDNILSLAFSILLKSPTFEQFRVPQNSSEMNFVMSNSPQGYGSVVYYDINYVARLIHGVIYDNMTIEEFVAKNGIQKNDWFKAIGGKGGSSVSTSAKVDDTESGDTDNTDSEPPHSEQTSSDSGTEKPNPSDTPDSSEKETPSDDEGGNDSSTESKTEGDTESDTKPEETD